ncbi:U84 protein [macacine betaherpesvirus 9]|uniref:U84 protein n=1 Tax=macacine betaherpesvirus 9 TaxID=2560568 RepID=A0A192XP44_9BETA|nr:U84 protein [macacine betaherpesvirus 9]ANC96567.1 U84 protein [macacine betaherpesvirus 9]
MKGKKRKHVPKTNSQIKTCVCNSDKFKCLCSFNKNVESLEQKCTDALNVSSTSEKSLNKEKYNNAIYEHSKLRKIFKATSLKESYMSCKFDVQVNDHFSKLPIDSTDVQSNPINMVKESISTCENIDSQSLCSPKNFLSEIYKLFRYYSATLIQIQVYSQDTATIDQLYEKLMEIANIVVTRGEQMISESLIHDQKTALDINKFLRGTDFTGKEAIMPIHVNSEKRKKSGIISLFINAPTEKDLFCAAHICTQFLVTYPNDILLNLAKLVQPFLLQEHMVIYNTFNRYVYWDNYAKLLKSREHKLIEK